MNDFIKSLMEEKNLKQKELAEILGISPSMVSQWNNETTNISLDNLFSMSKLFHVTVDELIEGKRSGESLEDKWKREYCIDEEAAKAAFIDEKKDAVLKYLKALKRADSRFFELYREKIAGNIFENQIKELSYLRQFYEIKIPRIRLKDGSWLSNSADNFDNVILEALINKYGKKNKDAIIWELKQIYVITHYGVGVSEDFEIKSVDDYYDDYRDIMGSDPFGALKEDLDIFYAVYDILPPMEKNNFITDASHKNWPTRYIYELIERGGDILYTLDDFKMLHYSRKDLSELEGDITPVSELDTIYALLMEGYSKRVNLTYEQYQTLINHPKMSQIEMEAKLIEKSPVHYWEYVKNNRATTL